MVRKITNNEYGKRYYNMSIEEQSVYKERVGQWLASYARSLELKSQDPDARLQDVITLSQSWNDDECKSFEDGVVLLSSLASSADTWLPDMLYSKAAGRAIRRMLQILSGVADRQENATASEGVKHETPADGGNNTPKENLQEENKRTTTGDTAAAQTERGATTAVAAPARPKHIDQYVHLLPKNTQEHAALVQGLFRELDEAREKERLLMNAPDASAADREVWAKKIRKCDDMLRKIFDELDAEWDKLVKEGRVTVDDLGNARVNDNAAAVPEPGQQELTSEQRARRREIRKWLTDIRRGNGAGREERVEKWNENFREYLTLEGDAAFGDDKIVEAANHYGIDLGKFKEDRK